MAAAYRYIFARVLRWRKHESIEPGGAAVFLSLLAVLNLASVLLMAAAVFGQPFATLLDYPVVCGVASYVLSFAAHHIWLLRDGRYKEIEAEFEGEDPPHLVAIFYVYIFGSIALFFLIGALMLS